MIKTKFLLVLGFIIAMAASSSVWAQQYARPDGTVTPAGWSEVGPGTTLHEAVDEVTADDTDYIDSGADNQSTVILSLGSIIDPGVYANNHILRYRCQGTGSGQAEQCGAALYNGDTPIADSGLSSAGNDVFVTQTFTIPEAAASGIDYANLDLQVRLTSGNLGNGESIQISWAELEVPNSAVIAPTVTSPMFADVTDTTATLGGNVTADNGTTVTDRGVEWGTASGGPYPNSVAQGTGGTGLFTVSVTGLPSSTLVYFRAWATNGGTGYSVESSFTTTAPAAPPTVTSPTFESVTATSAVLGGTVSVDGGATVTDRGVVWNTTSPAETGGTVVSIGSGLGLFSQLVGSLPAGTLIYFKAYATNTAGTAYSGELSFTTLVGLPTVDTPTVTAITATSADLGGNVSSEGGGTVSDRGVVWNTTSPPETGGTVVSMGSGLGTFFQTVGSLPTGTLVYFRAYATNETGTAYSTVDTFTPAGPPVVTSSVANITHNSAQLGGNVSSNGGATVTDRGVVWDTSTPPETAGTVVSMGSGLGTFSQIVSLPSGTQIYFKAFATNAVQTGYSVEDSFITETEPTEQASNITSPNTAGRSMRISWTRGNGDGSIVVMRLNTTAKIDPLDGNDYAANADYTLAPELPPQNFVVYKGSGNLVLVTGLSLSTTYSVAIYEYAGSGVDTDYLTLTLPAEASQATTDTAVHNEDNRVNCSDCHRHGSWSPNNAGLKTACDVCHTALGEAPAKLMFDNHLTPSKNPDIDVVACGFCHELHNPGGANTTSSLNVVTGVTQNNKSFLRANVDKYVSTASSPAYLHTDQPLREPGNENGDPEALAVTPDRAVEGGTDVTATPDDTQATGFCQVCHTLTNNHTNNPSTSGSDQFHDGLGNISSTDEVNCGECHQHNNKFIGVGGSVTCVACHDSEQGSLPRPIITTQFDRLSKHVGSSAIVTQEDCLVCHDQGGHNDQRVKVWDVDDYGLPSYQQLTPGAPTTDPAEGEQFEGHCLSCHDDGVAAALPASGGDQTQTSPFTGSGAPPVIDETVWASAAHNRSTAPIVSCVGACHSSGHGSEQNSLLAAAPAFPPLASPSVIATDFCVNCHDSDGPSTIDMATQFDTATDWQTTSASGALVNQRHDITFADQTYSGSAVTCKDCHSPHVNNASNPVNNPDTGATIPDYDFTNAAYNPGGHLDPLNPAGNPSGGFTEPDNIEFCLVCHDGAPPSGVTMSANMVDIASTFLGGGQHGNADGNGSGNGFLKPPFNTGTGEPPNYAALNCTTCHGAHGSDNIFNLRKSITVAGVAMTVGGWLGDTIGEDPLNPGSPRIGQTEYLLPSSILPENAQNDHNWGAWCSFCHQMESHGKDETVDCTSGHMHGGKQF